MVLDEIIETNATDQLLHLNIFCIICTSAGSSTAVACFAFYAQTFLETYCAIVPYAAKHQPYFEYQCSPPYFIASIQGNSKMPRDCSSPCSSLTKMEIDKKDLYFEILHLTYRYLT
jgi:hypothetical protein